ncbi:indoleamine 2,3-dioxygenase family protein [Microthyrium microscopicum]|uniref:Indoleamine 2,3-dioxygenase n=1 Tax=Microthyrium microscopicum TaxID=703497 RepID=A0A6A6UWC5_9PEZI|nr:indoleamine 2,3-dioxygenase family protein [Microthyrium microscopicum]
MSLPSTFPLLHDIRPDDISMSPFIVSTTRGFLPRGDPITKLPDAFSALENLLQRMPIKKLDGEPGLLANGKFGDAVLADLPDLTDVILKHAYDMVLITALYRDYSFLASAYLLEPCHERHVKGEEYGLARDRLPKNIAVPLNTVSKIAGFKPWMEYAGSYALYNYRLEDEKLGLEYDNTRLIRAFEHGLDPSSSEAGFVLVHVAMVRHSGELVDGSLQVIQSCADGNRDNFNAGLAKVVSAMTKINKTMNLMWNKSKPGDYNSFRTFIFGIAKQSMFPNGVIYEGVSPEPQFFRGESGANDSIIPLCDNLLEITMPNTPLTEILQDFRSYRPGNHREFLEWIHYRAQEVGTKTFALQDANSAKWYLQALDQVRDFRWRHWTFTREYILKHSKHKTATGGSPIVTVSYSTCTSLLLGGKRNKHLLCTSAVTLELLGSEV